MKQIALLAVLVVLAGCGGSTDAVVKFFNKTPTTSAHDSHQIDDKGNWVDNRHTSISCPHCGTAITAGTEYCQKPECGKYVTYVPEYRCEWCDGDGACPACSMMEQQKGACYNCRGEGVKAFQGVSKLCPNCRGDGKCPVCKGDGKCDVCKGAGKLDLNAVSSRVPKED